MLQSLGLNLTLADHYDDLFERPDADFVFPLLNRGGFLNSEMMLPLLCTRLGLPYLGASPILRGLADDKHLSKLCAAARGLPTAPWAIYRRGAPVEQSRCPAGTRMVIKPNASSASWGVQDAHDWAGVEAAVADIHSQGHDAIVEPFLNGSDVEVPVVTVDGEPVVMPMMLFEQADPTHLRTYYEKRDLVERGHKYQLVPFDDAEWVPRIAEMTRTHRRGVPAVRLWPVRVPARRSRPGAATSWRSTSRPISGRRRCSAARRCAPASARRELIETILYEGLRRHGLLDG